MRQRLRIHAVAMAIITAVLAASGSLHAQPLTITHLAGANGGAGSVDGTGSGARFNNPAAVAADASGNVYVADTENHTIRKIVVATGEVSTLAGLAGSSGSADGIGSAARFNGPCGITVDSSGNVFVADTHNNTIRKINVASGAVTTLASWVPGPWGIAADTSGNLFVARYWDNVIVRVVIATGEVSVLAGQTQFGSGGFADGTGTAARFNGPQGVAADGSGNVYVADTYNDAIRKIVVATAEVTTVVGVVGYVAKFSSPRGVAADSSGSLYVVDDYWIHKVVIATADVTFLAGPPYFSTGSVDGVGTVVRFHYPKGIVSDGSGNLYVADTENHTIRRMVLESGLVTTLAGMAAARGDADAIGSAARFDYPTGVAADGNGSIYVTDLRNHTIRKIVLADRTVTTFAGWAGSDGSADGIGTAARFYGPAGIAADGAGSLFVAESGNHTIRKIVVATGQVTTIAGQAEFAGSADGIGTAARFYQPSALAADGSGNLYVADTLNNTIRRIVLATGQVTTLAGKAGSEGSADGIGSAARFDWPYGVAADGSGSVYVADYGNHRIRKIVVATGAVTTLEEKGTYIGGTYGPHGIALDGLGNVYVTARNFNTIRKLVLSTGEVTTVAGNGQPGNADGTGTEAQFSEPSGMTIDSEGTVFVADTGNNCIRRGTVGSELADVATIDASNGATGQLRQLGSSPQTASQWLWEEVRRPSASRASLSSATIRNPTFTPDVPDLYVFRLTASHSSGSQSITTVSLTTAGATESLRADFTWTANPTAGQTIQFTDTSTGSPTWWSWDFGDGFSSTTAQHPTHAFATAGAFAVKLTVSSGTSSDTTTKTVTVAAAGASTCVVDASTMCLVGGRYRIRSHWRNQYAGGAVWPLLTSKLTDVTGAFWLFDPATYEYLIRINTATNNGRAWISIPMFTDVEFWIDVTDTASGRSKEYHSAPGNRTLIYDPYFFVYP